MSIRPIDLKMIIPKIEEASKVAVNPERFGNALASQMTAENHRITKQLTTVNESEQLTKSRVRDENSDSDDSEKQQENLSEMVNESIKDEITEHSVMKSLTIGTSIDIKA